MSNSREDPGDRDWHLVELGGEVLRDGVRLWLRFDTAASHLSGFTGCNTLAGGIEHTDGGGLRFLHLVMTRKYCASTAGLEQAFLGVVERTRRVRVSGDRLELFDESDNLVAGFGASDD